MAWLYKRPDSNRWWIGYRVNGKQVLRSTGSGDRAEAERQLAKVESMFSAHQGGSLTEQLYRELSGTTAKRIMFVAAVERWLDECRGANAVKTFARYRGTLDAFKSFLNATPEGPVVSDVSPEFVRTFLAKRRALLAISSVNLERKVLAAFFAWAFREELVDANPVARVKGLKLSRTERRSRRPFTAAEIKTVFAKAPSDFWRYMILGGFYTGQRLGDLICLSWGAVDLVDGVVRLTQRKTGVTVTLPIAKPLRSILEQIAERRGSAKATDPIWTEEARRYETAGSGQFSNEFHEILASSGLVEARKSKHASKSGRAAARATTAVSFHSLRHSFVSLLKAAGVSQGPAKELAGHSSDLLSDHYTDIPIETLKRAVAKLPEVTR